MAVDLAPRRPLSVRGTIILLVAASLVLALAVSIFAYALLGPTSARLYRDSEAIVARLAVVVDRSVAADSALQTLRRALVEGTAVVPEVRALVDDRAELSGPVAASLALERIPADMRLALAAAADTESLLEARLREALLQLEAGDPVRARRSVAAADSLHAEFVRRLGRAESAGLISLARQQERLVTLSAALQRSAPVAVVLALALAALTVTTLHRRVSRPLGHLDAALDAIARGDLDVDLPPHRQDEIGRLYDQFNRAVGILRESAARERRRTASLRDRLVRILEDSANEIYVIDAASLRFLEVNSRAAANLGRLPHELAALTPDDLLGVPPAQLEAEVFGPLREGRREQVVLSGRHRRSDGSTYPVELQFQYGAGEAPPVFLALGLDKTDHERQEAMIRQAQKMEAVGQLTGGIAHDFNNLLMVIQGNLELLGEGLDRDDAALADAALAAARRGAALTAHLLAFARRQPLAPEVLDLNRLVADMGGMLRRTLGEGLDLQTVLAAGLWRCEIDPHQLENALLNLALNARDAMGGRGTLTIETGNVRLDEEYAAAQAEVQPGQYVMLAVTDTGAGIAADLLERVFEPFFTTKERGRGSGLGLAMVYGFVKQSGGHVKVYSEVGQGTTVRIYLPRSHAAAAGGTGGSALPEPRGAGQTVLLVEDDEDVRTMVARHLRGLGYGVVAAGDADGALALLDGGADVAAVLTDVILAGDCNGRELVERIQARRPGLPALYMSGYTENAIVHQGRLDPGIRLLQKPFSRAELARKLAETLAG
ncbi:MAG: ATP-binding protein [Candidatus Krumholzibacteriia bacterium]